MAVYNDALGNKMIAMNYVIKEGDEICNILKSISILNENGILLEAEQKAPTYWSLMWEKLINFLVKLKNVIASFFTKIKQKIRSLMGPSKKVVIEDLEVVDVTYYAETWNAIEQKYRIKDSLHGIHTLIRFVLNGPMDVKVDNKHLSENCIDAVIEVQDLEKEMENLKTTNLKGQKASDVLDILDSLDINKVLNMLNTSITYCKTVNLKADSTKKFANKVYDMVDKKHGEDNTADLREEMEKCIKDLKSLYSLTMSYFTTSAKIWSIIQQESAKIYSTVAKYVHDNKQSKTS